VSNRTVRDAYKNLPAEPEAGGRAPGAADMLPLFLAAPIAAGLAAGAIWRSWAGVRVAVIAAVLSAATLGAPALFWALERGSTRPGVLGSLGAAAGALAPVLAAAAGALGLWFRGSFAYVRWVFGYGVPIPAYGTMPWRDFLFIEVLAALVGAASFAACRLAWRKRPTSDGRTTQDDCSR
jgi:hypothetical protein